VIAFSRLFPLGYAQPPTSSAFRSTMWGAIEPMGANKSRILCYVAAALLLGGAVPAVAHADASPSPCSVSGTYGTNVVVASSGNPAAVTSAKGDTTMTISLRFKLEVTGFTAGFSIDSYSDFSGAAPIAPGIALSFDGGGWQSPGLSLDRSGTHGGANGYPWSVTASTVSDVAAGSTHTLAVHIEFSPGMTPGAYHTWFWFSGALPCNGTSSDSTAQQQSTVQYAPSAPAPARSSSAATTVTGKAVAGSSGAGASPSASSSTAVSASASASAAATSSNSALAASQPSDSPQPVDNSRMTATASESSSSSLTWLAVLLVALLLVAGGTGTFVIRRRRATAAAAAVAPESSDHAADE
jgi:hypothetical protein